MGGWRVAQWWTRHLRLGRWEVAALFDPLDWTVGVSVDVERWVWLGLLPMVKVVVLPVECICTFQPASTAGGYAIDAEHWWDMDCPVHTVEPGLD